MRPRTLLTASAIVALTAAILVYQPAAAQQSARQANPDGSPDARFGPQVTNNLSLARSLERTLSELFKTEVKVVVQSAPKPGDVAQGVIGRETPGDEVVLVTNACANPSTVKRFVKAYIKRKLNESVTCGSERHDKFEIEQE